MTGEVLDAARHASILQTLQVVRHHRCSHVGIVAESTGADDDVVGVGVHVGHRGKVYVEAVFVQIRADGIAAVVGVLGVACGTDGTHRLKFLHMEVLIVSDTGHTTTFLVDAEQGRAIQGAYLLDECRQLCLVIDVVGIENDAAHGVFLVHSTHGGVHGL